MELLPLLARRLLHMTLWCGMGTFWLLLVALPALNSALWFAEPPPPLPLICPPSHSAVIINMSHADNG